MNKLLITTLLAILLTACVAPQRKMTRSEWIDITSREYQNKTQEEVIQAAEKLFTLADGDDFQFSHTQNGMLAHRRWFLYLVIAAADGVDYWKLNTEKTEHGVKVTIELTVAGNTTTAGGMNSINTSSILGMPVNGNAIYTIFWERMDYLMGKTDHWMTCDEINKKIKNKELFGGAEQLCLSATVDDKHPDPNYIKPKKTEKNDFDF